MSPSEQSETLSSERVDTSSHPQAPPAKRHRTGSAPGEPPNGSRRSSRSITPLSEDSMTPDPPQSNTTRTRRAASPNQEQSDDDFDEDKGSNGRHTSSRNQHASSSMSPRRSMGADHARLLRRKEQNRAAQRAFRERKEKHVKDLEDKVAALQNKVEEVQSENENLRDLHSLLQNEIMMLKHGVSFTQGRVPGPYSRAALPRYCSSKPSRSANLPPLSQISRPRNSKWNPLPPFNTGALNRMDSRLQTIDGDMFYDDDGLSPPTPYTMIASNPMFMSYASNFDSPPASNPEAGSPPYGGVDQSISHMPAKPTRSPTMEDLFTGYIGQQPGAAPYNGYPPNSVSPSFNPAEHHPDVNLAAGHKPAPFSRSSAASTPQPFGPDSRFINTPPGERLRSDSETWNR